LVLLSGIGSKLDTSSYRFLPAAALIALVVARVNFTLPSRFKQDLNCERKPDLQKATVYWLCMLAGAEWPLNGSDRGD
jgi:hypothetical protein